MRSVVRSLAYLWALPNTVLGLLLGLLSFRRPRIVEGAIVFDGATRGVMWLVKRFKRTAITFGHVILARPVLEGALLRHELHHVRQYQWFGPLYLPVYLAIYPFTGYRRHPFEAAARRAAARERGV